MSIAAVRSQIAARLIAATALTRESAEPIEAIRASTHSPVHLEFAVGTDHESYAARQAMERTAIQIVVPYQLEAKDRIDGATGYSAMLTRERAIVAALQESNWGALNPRLAALTGFDSRREAGPDGWIWLVITCTALHPTVA